MARLPRPEAGDSVRTPATGFPGFIVDKRVPRIIAGDIWACFRHLIEDRAKKGDKTRALAYLDQALEFYEAAANPQIGARPLLFYYSFLNTAKAFLVARDVNLPPLVRHGVSDPKANVRSRLRLEGQKVRIEAAEPDRSQLLAELMRALGGTVPIARQYSVLDTLLAQIPAIHRTYVTVRRKVPRFAPILEFELLTNGTHVWSRVVLDGRDHDVTRTLRRISSRRLFRKTFTRVAAPVGKVWLETQKQPGQRRVVDTAIAAIAEQVRECGVWSLLTRDGYRYYFGDFFGRERLPQLASVYAAMFYLGSITRYKPYDFDRIVGGRYSWLVNEFLATQPRQFLYQLASTLAGTDVVIPYAIGEGG